MADRNDNVVLGANEEAARKKGHNILPKIISVLLAFILWFYVMTVESPINQEVFRSIPIEVLLPSSGELSIYSGYNVTVDVTVSGKKSDLNQISAESFKATADATAYTQAGKYSVPVDIEVPGGFNLVDKSVNLLSVYLDAKATSSVPVQIKLTEYTLAEGLELGGDNDIEKSVSEIFLSGPKSILDTIEAALVTVPCGNVSSSIRASGNVQLLDAYGSVVTNPYVSVGTSAVDVRIPVFMTKEIELKVDFKNKLLNSSNSKVEISPSAVKVRGSVETLSVLEHHVISTIDEKSLTADKLSIPLTLPEGISCVDGTEAVDVTITHTGTTTKILSVEDIKVVNPNDFKYTLSLDTVNVTLRGKTDELSKISAEDITLTVDLSELKEGAGSVTLPVKVEVSDTYAKSVYELGEYNMVVTVK
ncbi:MAG: hypothetical protein IJB57_06120 [Clostridia bacterium]|nr:hypothetical protein [Clostridia bacterium]